MFFLTKSDENVVFAEEIFQWYYLWSYARIQVAVNTSKVYVIQRVLKKAEELFKC